MLRCFRAYRMCALLLTVPCWSIPVYQVQAVGPAGYASSATAINATGAVVGNYVLPDGTQRAFLWQGGQSTTLELPEGAVRTWATAISGNGQAGGFTDYLQAPQGMVWDNFGSAISTAGSYITGMNQAGDAAGMAIGADGAGYAFVTRNGTMISLGQPGGGDWSSANAINSSGTAAGTAMNATGLFQAFRAPANGWVTLLNGLGGTSSYGQAINSSGAVAGHSQVAGGAMRATVWLGNQAIGLGTLGGTNSYSYGINAAGQVVGYSDLATGDRSSAFLYSDGFLYDLNGLLGPGSEWQLLAAYGMNDAGQIVGRGVFRGEAQAFLLTPVSAPEMSVPVTEVSAPVTGVPEPSTLLLFGAPLLALIGLRARHK